MTVADTVSTKQKVFGEKDARELLSGIDKLISARGKKVVTVDLKHDKSTWKELAPLMLGPTGNLRAPVIRRGTTLLVGFEEGAYKDLLK